MDPPTAIRLSELFCDDLYMPGNFPLPGTFHVLFHVEVFLIRESLASTAQKP